MMKIPGRCLDVCSDMRQIGLLLYDNRGDRKERLLVKADSFDQYFEIGVGSLGTMFFERCAAFVGATRDSSGNSDKILRTIVQFFIVNESRFKTNNVDVSLFLSIFEKSGLFQEIYDIIFQKDDVLITTVCYFVTWVSYTHEDFGCALQRRGFVQAICQMLLKGDHSQDANTMAMSALYNLLSCHRGESEIGYVTCILESLFDFANKTGLIEEMASLCYIVAATSTNIDIYPQILNFYDFHLDRMPIDYGIATPLILVGRLPEILTPLSRTNMFNSYFASERNLSDVNFSRLLKMISFGYGYLSDLTLKDQMIGFVDTVRMVGLLTSPDRECVINALEFIREAATDVMPRITHDCRLTHGQFCELHLSRLIRAGSLAEKVATTKLLKSLVLFSKAVRVWVYTSPEVYDLCQDFFESDDPQQQLSVLEMLCNGFQTSFDRSEPFSEFLHKIFDGTSVEEILQTLSQTSKPNALSEVSAKILDLRDVMKTSTA